MRKAKKVSESCQELLSCGLIDRSEALRIALVATLLPTLEGSPRTLPAEALMDATGLDHDEAVSQVKLLGTYGIEVEHIGGGYRLVDTFDDLLLPEAVVPRLLELAYSARARPGTLAETCTEDKVMIPSLGLPYLYAASCGSTNRWLKGEAKGMPNGAIAVTDDQTEGRGRLGRIWSSEPGKDLTFSLLLRSSALTYEAGLLSLTAGLAVAEVLERLPGLRGRVRVKWPNDVLIDDKKVCGILLESSSQGEGLEWIVVGIGLNVNSDPASRPQASEPSQREASCGKPVPTSLRVESGASVGRRLLLVELLTRLSDRWFDSTIADSFGELRLRDGLLGRRVEIYAGPPDGVLTIAGEAVGIDDRGRLLVKERGGMTKAISTGEATLGVDIPTT